MNQNTKKGLALLWIKVCIVTFYPAVLIIIAAIAFGLFGDFRITHKRELAMLWVTGTALAIPHLLSLFIMSDDSYDNTFYLSPKKQWQTLKHPIAHYFRSTTRIER